VTNRFLQPLPVREAALAAGWTGALVAWLLLAPPLAAWIFAPDARHLSAAVAGVLERVGFGAGIVGLCGLVAALAWPRSRRLELPVSRGAAVVACLTVAAALLALEGTQRFEGWRAWGSPLRTPLPVSAMRGHGRTTLQPGVYATGIRDYFRPQARRTIFYTINRWGLRGQAPVLPKPPGCLRILCVGGSTTFGYAVTDGEEWPVRLGQALAGGHAVEVLNGARLGATTWSNYAYLRDRLLRFEPDLVLLYEGFNDLWRGVRLRWGAQPDYGSVERDGPGGLASLDLGPPRTWPPRPSFAAHRLGAWLETRLETAAMLDAARAGTPVAFAFAPGILDIYEGNLTAMVRLCRSRGVRVVMATFAGCDDPGAAPEARRLRVQYVLDQMPGLDVASAEHGLALYREITRRVAASENVPLVDLARALPRDDALYVDTIHFTAAGEQRVAVLLAQDLAARALLPPPAATSVAAP
jgi:lysophospholipase L1-like esterase